MTRPRYVLRSGASISSTANSFSAAFSREITPRGSLFVATSGANLCIFCALVDGSLEPIISFTETAQFGHVEPLYDEDYYAVTWALDDRAPHGRSTAAAAASPPVITTTARGRVSINLSAAAAAGVGAGAGASVGEGSRRAAQLVVAGGRGGVVTVVDACTGQLRCRLLGHGRDVNHVVTHPLHEWLVLSGSKDETVSGPLLCALKLLSLLLHTLTRTFTHAHTATGHLYASDSNVGRVGYWSSAGCLRG